MTIEEKLIVPDNKVLSKKGKVVASDVCRVLSDFCRQNSEFEQAVLQGGSLADCIEHTVKGSGSSIADIEVYRRAVEFFFPTAKINVNMTIDLGDEGFSDAESIGLSLDDLLDF